MKNVEVGKAFENLGPDIDTPFETRLERVNITIGGLLKRSIEEGMSPIDEETDEILPMVAAVSERLGMAIKVYDGLHDDDLRRLVSVGPCLKDYRVAGRFTTTIHLDTVSWLTYGDGAEAIAGDFKLVHQGGGRNRSKEEAFNNLEQVLNATDLTIVPFSAVV